MSLSTSSSHLEETRAPVQLDPSTHDQRRRHRLNDPALHAALANTLRKKGVHRKEVDDLVQETLTQASRSALLPDEDEACRKYVFGVARNVLADHRLAQTRRPEAGAVAYRELTRLASTRAQDATEAKLTVEGLVQRADEGRRRAFGWFVRNTFGVSYKTIADEVGLSYKQVWTAAEEAREWVSNGLQRASVPVMILLFLWALARGEVKPRQDVAKPHETKVEKVDPRPAPSAAPALTPPQPLGQVTEPPVYDGFDEAKSLSDLRGRALLACDEARWASCLRGLDMAKEVDAKGDQAPRIQAARAKATQALAGAKP